MNKKTWILTTFFFALFFYHFENQAQTINKSYKIDWQSNIIYTITDEKKAEFLYFSGAKYMDNYTDLPQFYEKIPVNNFYSNLVATISNEKYATLTESEIKLIPVSYREKNPAISAEIAVEKKNSFFAVVHFVPIIKRESGEYAKLVSFDLTVSMSGNRPKQSKGYVSNSVLASGTWYKIAVNKTGIHQVTYADLVTLGIPVSGLRSDQIALFGNGSGMLSESNAVNRTDDIAEIAIEVMDGGDGIFGEGDYFIFYAQSPHSWEYDTLNKTFNHQFNIYRDYNYYFINVNSGIGTKKRIKTVDNSALIANKTATNYHHYSFYETDLININESTKNWYGDLFDVTTSRTYSFAVPSVESSTATLRIKAANLSTSSSSFAVSVNNTALSNFYLSTISGDVLAKIDRYETTFIPQQSPLVVALTYSKPSSSASAYLDWIEVETTCKLSMHSSQFPFCNTDVIGSGNVTQFSIANSTNGTRVWDVTSPIDIYALSGQLSNGTFSFKSATETLRKFYAFNGSSFYSVTPIGTVGNQDLHGNSFADMIIITHPNFSAQAERLAEHRRSNDNITVKVVTPRQIYNEFGSGGQDPVAIRDYMKMIYDKSNGLYPKYLLLFGRPSYDYRGRVSGTTLFVPNWQNSMTTYILTDACRSNDDFFGILDENEGYNCRGYIDIAIGRFPVSTAAQAKLAVDKSINYTAKKELVTRNNSAVVSNFADWRNSICFIADDEDNGFHERCADIYCTLIAGQNKTINFDKIYCDAYQQESSSGGQRYPEVNKAINHRMAKGAMFLTYVGHSGKDSWAHERILEFSDINNWTNKYNQPIITTLSCEFGWYDRPLVSPAEATFLNNNGGATAIITTSRTAYTGSNHVYAQALFGNVFQTVNGKYKTIGELNMYAKNASGGANDGINMFYTIGDPSMPLPVPTYQVTTDSINGHSVTSTVDTMSALSKVTIKGKIVDQEGNFFPDFNGSIYPSVFDKKVLNYTLQNDPASPYFEFEVQKNILYKGNISVHNGIFEFSFYTPKDINYTYGNGKISYYAKSESYDATGYFDQFIIGGTADSIPNDKNGPTIDLFLNDESFVNNGTTNQNPKLIAKIKDDYGLNTTGNGIGHDLVAILDEKTESQIILNDYYEPVRDSFAMGVIHYPFENLSVGKHRIKVRAWDIVNNMSENVIEFNVVSDEKLSLDHVLNYPNPFTTHTSFFFEHNQPGESFEIMIQVYTISGKLIKTLRSTQYLEGNRSRAIEWDGKDDFGDKIGKGVYLYKMRVRNSKSEQAEKIEKIAIL